MRVVIHAWKELNHPDAGGSERLVDQMARGLVDHGHVVTVIAGGPVGTRSYPTINSGGTFSQYLRVPWIDQRWASDADLVIDVANGITFCSPLWRRGPTLLLVHHVHTDQWATRFGTVVATAGRIAEARFIPIVYRRSLVVVPSPSTAVELQKLGVDEARIRIVPNVVTARPVPVSKLAEPQFVVLGRLMPHKRVDLVLRAWERVRPHSGGMLVIAGDGPDRAKLESNAGPSVRFVGYVEEEQKAVLLAESWVLIHGAMHEGWGIAVTEAGVQRTPAIGFDVPGVRDSIVDGRSGILVQTEDELVEAWMRLARAVEERDRLGRGAAAVADQYTEGGAADALDEIAREAVRRTNC